MDHLPVAAGIPLQLRRAPKRTKKAKGWDKEKWKDRNLQKQIQGRIRTYHGTFEGDVDHHAKALTAMLYYEGHKFLGADELTPSKPSIARDTMQII